MSHQKPTKEEMEASIAAAEAAVDGTEPKLPDPNKPKPEDAGKGTEEIKPGEEKIVTPKKPDGSEEKKPDEKKGDEEEDDGKWRDKFVASSREAIVLNGKQKKLDEKLAQIDDIQPPSDEDMQKVYPEWETMTDFEKKIAKNDAVFTKQHELLKEIRKESKSFDEWGKKVDEFADNPESLQKYPQLEGKESEFKVFASKPTRRGVDFEDLVAAFSFDVSKSIKPKKGQQFETSSGGPNEKPKPKSTKLTVEQGAALKRTNYAEFQRQLTSGNIEEPEL